MAEIDWAEARRYLGFHKPGGVVDADLETELALCGAKLQEIARPRGVWKRFPLTLGEGTVALGGMTWESAHLRRHLADCEGAYLFAATLGVEVDRLIHAAGITNVGRALMFQACAASLLEVYCDECCGKMAGEVAGEGLFLKPRFSPGYGDWSVACQRELLRGVEATKRIGLSAAESMMLTPTKSVTAVVGLTRDGTCRPSGCRSCPKTDCAFRRA